MNLILTLMVLAGGLFALIASVRFRNKVNLQHNAVLTEYRPIDVLKIEVSSLVRRYSDRQQKYIDNRTKLVKFESIIDAYDLGVGTIDANSYEPLFNEKDLTFLGAELENVKRKAKALVSAKRACVSHLPANIAINGRRGAAKTFVNREIRLRIRCLDNEVKAAIASVEWNNINRLIERVRTKFQEINDETKLVKIFLQEEYLELKVRELRLVYESKQLKMELKEEERAERQRIREEQRDEERVKKELAKAERDRTRMEKLVERELARIGSATDAQKEKLALHQKELELLRARESRAVSLAQLTRAGYVYIISNEASFGEGICKIGMTRRLDPNDRVKELGDASVPDLFKIHAFIYTEDAPTLEKYLHDRFDERRVNLVNRRKEFFQLESEEALKALEVYEGSYNLEPLS